MNQALYSKNERKVQTSDLVAKHGCVRASPGTEGLVIIEMAFFVSCALKV